MREAKHVEVRGRVQGVGYRWFTRDAAHALGVGGWVKNELDGSVAAYLEGEPAALEALVDKMRMGPSYGRVDTITVEDATPKGIQGFEIRR